MFMKKMYVLLYIYILTATEILNENILHLFWILHLIISRKHKKHTS